MKIDQFTYGNTPAAIYLANRLNELNNPSIVRKVTRLTSGLGQIIHELEVSNVNGTLSAHTIACFCNALRDRAKINSGDTLVDNLVTNILIGRVKVLIRQVRAVKLFEKRQLHKKPRTGPFSGTYPPEEKTKPLTSIADTKTAKGMIEKSKQRLAKNNKLDTLY